MRSMTVIGLILLAVGTGGFQKMCSNRPSADDLDRRAGVVAQVVCNTARESQQPMERRLEAEFDWDGFDRRAVNVDPQVAVALEAVWDQLRLGYRLSVSRDSPAGGEVGSGYPVRWVQVESEGELLVTLEIIFRDAIAVQLEGEEGDRN